MPPLNFSRATPAILCLLLAACASELPPAAAQTPAPIGQAGWAPDGVLYARAHCGSCHAVERDQTLSPHPAAPTFEELASTPGMTGMALNVWLYSAHEEMPHLLVERDDVEDLAAYLTSLQEH